MQEQLNKSQDNLSDVDIDHIKNFEPQNDVLDQLENAAVVDNSSIFSQSHANQRDFDSAKYDPGLKGSTANKNSASKNTLKAEKNTEA